MSFDPTPEQLAVIAFAKGDKRNLMVRALAGAAKTSTLVLVTNACKSYPILALAFNKTIADEMGRRFSPNTTTMTLNSLGHRAWNRHVGGVRLNKTKVGQLVREELEDLHGAERDEAYKSFSEIVQAVDGLKTAGYIPNPPTGFYSLMSDEDAYSWLDPTPELFIFDLIKRVSQKSFRAALAGEIDFADQLLLPTLCNSCSLMSAPLVLIDEAQDLSALNHVMLKKIVGPNRLIAVGDPNQAIYGFRGAHEDSMDLLRQEFRMEELPLTISFRCPKAVVEHVRWKAPDMRWPEWAKEGSIMQLHQWNFDNIPNGAAVICRNNAPLFEFALNALKHDRYPKFVGGRDIVKPIIKILRDLGPDGLDRQTAIAKLDAFAVRNARKHKDKAAFHDRVECARLFIEQTATLGEAIERLNALAVADGSIHLMTGHKSKGLEFSDVFFLDQQLVSDRGQDPNLRYVICTRTLENLTYITSEGFV